MAVISMKQFLEAGVHFGHQTKRWHPKMSPYIYGIKNGVHVIDLRQTLSKLKDAYEYIKNSAQEGRLPLFVGTKTQIQSIVKEEASRCGCPYINFRWLGGLLTNFGTVKQSVARMKSFEELAGEDRNYEGFIKKEALIMERKRLKLERSLGGVRNMHSIPSILFITDCHKEQLALKEAQKLGITVVGVSDTNCDPTGIDYMIPGNDDSPRAVSLYANVISTAVIEGLNIRAKNLIKEDNEENKKIKKTPNIVKETKIEPAKEEIIAKKNTAEESKTSLSVEAKLKDKNPSAEIKKTERKKLKTKLLKGKILTPEKNNNSKNLSNKSEPLKKVNSLEKNTSESIKKTAKEKESPPKIANSAKLKKSKDIETENKK
tara:strand:+ start:110 stop:1231 length:1122 start_codon:yes stop_codon:yes gene_type:complete